MSIQDKPDYKVFASGAKSGEIETFPDIHRGWGVTIDRTGEIPPMEWFNAIGKRADEWLLYLTQRGIPEWDSSLDYPKSAMVMHSDSFYIAKKASKGESPSASSSSWAKLSDFIGVPAVTQSTGSSTTQVMSQDVVTKALNAKTNESVFQSRTSSGNAVILPSGSPIAFIFNKDGSFNLFSSESGTKFSVDKDGEVKAGVVPFSRVTDAPILGVNQEWKAVSRQINTLYTNASKSPIFVFARTNAVSNNFRFNIEVGGVIADSIAVHGTATGTSATTTKELGCGAIIPPGTSYKFIANGVDPSGVSISYAAELS